MLLLLTTAASGCTLLLQYAAAALWLVLLMLLGSQLVVALTDPFTPSRPPAGCVRRCREGVPPHCPQLLPAYRKPTLHGGIGTGGG